MVSLPRAWYGVPFTVLITPGHAGLCMQCICSQACCLNRLMGFGTMQGLDALGYHVTCPLLGFFHRAGPGGLMG